MKNRDDGPHTSRGDACEGASDPLDEPAISPETTLSGPPGSSLDGETLVQAYGVPDDSMTRPRSSPVRGVFLPLYSPGDLLKDRYRIVRFLAHGGMGEVYEADDLELGERVAVKVVRSDVADEAALARFRQEIQLALRVTHPNVCRIHDLRRQPPRVPGSDGPEGQPGLFLTMELLRGETLAAHLQQSGPMAPDEALPLVEQMTAGLAAAHRAGVVHRDFNPKNVILVPSSEAGRDRDLRVVITDFGLAHAAYAEAGAGLTAVGTLIGTPTYMAPEQVEGAPVTPQTDIYALGCVLYEMITGHWPFRGDSPVSTAVMRITHPPVPPTRYRPDLDPVWEEVILRCLALKPEERFGNAAEVAAALKASSGPPKLPPSLPAPPSASDPATEPADGRPSFFRRYRVVVIALLALLAAGASFFFTRSRPAPPEAASASEGGRARAGALPSRPVGRSAARVAILGFRNLSGREEAEWLGTAFSEMLGTELAAGEGVRTVPGEEVARARLEISGGERSDDLDAAAVSRLRRNLGVRYVVLGSYSALGERGGDRLRLDARLQDGDSGEVVAAVAEEGVEAELFELVTRVGARLREHLGAADLSPDDRRRLAASRPLSREAARLYAEGLARLRRFDAVAARDLLARAVAETPNFPLAHSALAEAWAALGYDTRAAEEAETASKLAGDLPREERMQVEARSYEIAGRWPEAVEIYRSLWRFYPDEIEYGLRLAQAETAAGEARRALETLTELRSMAEDDPRIALAEADAALGLGDFTRQLEAAREAADEARRRGARLLLARARYLEGVALRNLGEIEEAQEAYVEARSIYTEVGDSGAAARTANSQAILADGRGNTARARDLYDQALETSRAIGDERGAARALNNLAILEKREGDTDRARELYTEALAVFRRTGDGSGESRTLSNLANLLSNQGDLREARRRYDEALALQRRRQDQAGMSATLLNLADLSIKEGDIAAAEEHYAESLRLAEESGARSESAYAGAGRGLLRWLRGAPAEGKESLEEALALARDIDDAPLVAWTLTWLGEVEIHLALLEKAEEHLEEALALHRELASDAGAGETLRVEAERRLAAGDAAAALPAAREAVELLIKGGSPPLEARARAVLAQAQLAAGRKAEALVTAEAARGLIDDPRRRWERLRTEVPAARVLALAGRRSEGIRALEAALGEARTLGYRPHELEARLALAELDALGEAPSPELRQDLQALADEAEEAGFSLLARKARKLAAGERHPST